MKVNPYFTLCFKKHVQSKHNIENENLKPLTCYNWICLYFMGTKTLFKQNISKKANYRHTRLHSYVLGLDRKWHQ